MKKSTSLSGWRLAETVAILALTFTALSVALVDTQGRGGGPKAAGPLRVVDDLGTEVGFYMGSLSGLTQLGGVVRLVPATNRWVMLKVNPDGLAIMRAGSRVRYESADCTGQPYMLTGAFGQPQIAQRAVGGAGGLYYYYAVDNPITITQRSFQQFTNAGGLTPCSGTIGGQEQYTDAIAAAMVDLSGLFLPPFHIVQ